MLDGVYLGLDEVIPDGLYVCPSQSKGLKFGRDTWREAPHKVDPSIVLKS